MPGGVRSSSRKGESLTCGPGSGHDSHATTRIGASSIPRWTASRHDAVNIHVDDGLYATGEYEHSGIFASSGRVNCRSPGTKVSPPQNHACLEEQAVRAIAWFSPENRRAPPKRPIPATLRRIKFDAERIRQ